MSLPPRTDFWHVGIVPSPITALTNAGALAIQRERITWLPDPGPWRYLADPFALKRGATTHVFVEAFDYRTKHAVIEQHEFNADFQWQRKSVALSARCHLSYPFLIEEHGEIFMIPESQRAGEIALYRAKNFPDEWTRETALLPGVPGAEASVIRHEGRWWMFFTVVGPNARDQRELHVAHADELTGPWIQHASNPVLDDRSGARPGGTPFVGPDGKVILPVQDCSRTYGGAIRFLRFTTLAPGHVAFEHLPSTLTGDLVSSTHADGLHTLAGCGKITTIDVKRIARTWSRYGIDLQRRFRRFTTPKH